MQRSTPTSIRGRSARLRPLMLALCAAGCTTATMAQLRPGEVVVAPTALPDVVNKFHNNATKPDAIQITTNVTETSASMKIDQDATRGLIEMANMRLGSQASIDVTATSASAVTVLRAVDLNASYIYGRITANDRLFLVNPNGIYVGPGASISARGLALSALDISSEDAADNYARFMTQPHVVFRADTSAYGNTASYGSPVVEVDSKATLTSTDGGGVMLIGDHGVRNRGDIGGAGTGSITMLATGQAEVDIGDSGFIKLVASEAGPLRSMVPEGRVVVNEGTLDAPNGTITLLSQGWGFQRNVFGDPSGLSAYITEGSLNGVINTGTIKAQSSGGGLGGSVSMRAEGDEMAVLNSGTVDVRALDADSQAGSILLSAQHVLVGNVRGATAQLLASGPAGGGVIVLNNATTPFNEGDNTILVLPSAELNADAELLGDGGLIRLSGLDGLSLEQVRDGTNYSSVRAFGRLSARGGSNGGKGGVVEMGGDQVVVRSNDTDPFTDQAYGHATIQVGARAAGNAGGLWSVYSPGITIGNRVPGTDWFSTYINVDDINLVLNSGASVGMSTAYQFDAQVYSRDLTIEAGTWINQAEGGGGNYLYLQSGRDLVVENNTAITSSSGKLDVALVADADGDGRGSLILEGYRSGPVTLGAGRKQALAMPMAEGDAPITIQTNGGRLDLNGAKPVGQAGPEQDANYDAGVYISGTLINTQGATGRGDVFIQGAGGATGYLPDSSRVGPSQNGVTITGNTEITAGNVNIVGQSMSATGVSLSDTTISTDKGTIDVRGLSQGGTYRADVGQPIGVDIGSNVVLNAGQGHVKILGRGIREAVADVTAVPSAFGVRIQDLTITTSGGAAGQQITLVGQSGGSVGEGVSVSSGAPGLRVHDQAGSGLAATADLVIGASADANAPQALNLGTPYLNTTGRLNYRPAGVSSEGQLTESPATAIRVGTGAGGVPTNFIVRPQWFNAASNSSIPLGSAVVIGSNIHTGLISVENEALAGAGIVTLQNQGAGAAGIQLGAQSTTIQSLSLVSGGNITQSGAINVAQLNLLPSPGAGVQLNDAGNRISGISYDNRSTTPSVSAQAVPAASSRGGIAAYSVDQVTPNNSTFSALNVTYYREQTRLPVDDRPHKPFESSDALNELRTDVYVRGQLSRPQLCTPANTSGAVASEQTAVDPLSLEWTKVRRGAQLTNCSGVQADSNCSAF